MKGVLLWLHCKRVTMFMSYCERDFVTTSIAIQPLGNARLRGVFEVVGAQVGVHVEVQPELNGWSSCTRQPRAYNIVVKLDDMLSHTVEHSCSRIVPGCTSGIAPLYSNSLSVPRMPFSLGEMDMAQSSKRIVQDDSRSYHALSAMKGGSSMRLWTNNLGVID